MGSWRSAVKILFLLILLFSNTNISFSNGVSVFIQQTSRMLKMYFKDVILLFKAVFWIERVRMLCRFLIYLRKSFEKMIKPTKQTKYWLVTGQGLILWFFSCKNVNQYKLIDKLRMLVLFSDLKFVSIFMQYDVICGLSNYLNKLMNYKLCFFLMARSKSIIIIFNWIIY